MTKKPNKRKYTKKNPTPTEKLAELQSNYDALNEQAFLDQQDAEMVVLKERNKNLIEAIETLARSSRLEKQNKDLARFNRSINDTVAVSECEAGYTHSYEGRKT